MYGYMVIINLYLNTKRSKDFFVTLTQLIIYFAFEAFADANVWITQIIRQISWSVDESNNFQLVIVKGISMSFAIVAENDVQI